MRAQIEKILEEEVNPLLALHGGSIELVEIDEEGVVKVRLKGGCSTCPSAQMTLTNLVENAIKKRLPEISKVEAV
ncbi:MAG: NifU family protein [Candidatus Omnitrophota bacterium]|nr:MAG: NifU family protein [Candidatus Omnitrophota bacterium]